MSGERYRHLRVDLAQCGDPEPDPLLTAFVCRWCGEPLERYTPMVPEDFDTPATSAPTTPSAILRALPTPATSAPRRGDGPAQATQEKENDHG